MGSNNGFNCEKPLHEVLLDDFYIGKFQVTQEEWSEIMKHNPSSFKGKSLPVETISYNLVLKFIEKLNKKTDEEYRLPTEAEWEYAAKGGDRSKGYALSGSKYIFDSAWFIGNSRGKTHQVGTRKPNELGLHDMSGNVGEWCNDKYAVYPANLQVNPKGADNCLYRVIRGGSWGLAEIYCRPTYRQLGTPTYLANDVGFRLAKNVNN